MREKARRLGGARRGSALVEFALAAPVLLLLTTATYDYGTATSRRMEVASAARAGAAYVTASGWNAAGITGAVQSATGNAGIAAVPAPAQFCGCADASTGVAAAACGSPCAGGDVARSYVTVSARATYTFVFPLPGRGASTTLQATAVARVP